ncbi:hypothetical protein VSS37_07160 [Candidatus Thiothrix sp. Deng01]|uniref:SGNH/GDSL hydrolase family protein n=1 Tax=Candidatus Thiothrix phosphatis TaxID=3112415 RepID=A0ABU6CWH2_9GAMM|nr:hypothetical protein [Candidatus Thiothrix sp. Deng01]MEB4590753.1 hypothetical protein [Candidatus Thiothrix sp. Deng01]
MQFWTALPAGFLLAACVWLGLVYGQVGNPTPSWVYHAYQLKQRLADAIRQPKIVIVSGSNALFGLNSSLISQTYHRPVVNQGVNAAMLLPYILYRSQQALKPGDIALLPLEYPLYLYDGATNTQLIDQILARDPGFFWRLGWKERFNILWETPLERIWQGYHPSDAQPPVTVLYGVHNIDPATGDQRNTGKARLVGQELREWEGHRDMPPHQYGKDDKPDNLAWRYLRDYIAWAKQHDVCLIFVPSAFHERAFYHEDPIERAFYTDLPGKVRALGATYVGSPFDYMYGMDDLFNTEYHLTDEGRQKHTARLIRDLGPSLEPYCGETSPQHPDAQANPGDNR